MSTEDYAQDEVREALQKAFPAVDTKLRRDLWPAMLRRMEAPAVAVPWYDWVLAGGLACVIALFPKVLLLLAYHL